MQKISFIGATFTAGSVGLGVFAGWGCQLYGVRTVATIGTIIYVGGNLAASFCTSITALILTQGLLQAQLVCLRLALLSSAHTLTSGEVWPSVLPVLEVRLRTNILAPLILKASCQVGVGGIFWSFVVRALIAAVGLRVSLITRYFALQ